MPLFLHQHLSPEGALGLWEIEEEEVFFLEQLQLWPDEIKQLERMKGRRRTEWLAVRFLLHHMSGRKQRGALIKDEFGKPHLEKSNFHISISHSRRFAAAIAGPSIVGIDIQVLVPRIKLLAPKFMRPEEMESLQTDTAIPHLHVYWGAKEALYKAYGRRQLDFKENLMVRPFLYSPKGGRISGWITKGDVQHHVLLQYEMIEDYVLVYGQKE